MGAPPDAVILLHGLGRSSTSMEPLARALRGAGLAVLNLDMPTRRHGVAGLAAHVDHASSAWRGEHGGALHLIGHSLGGLVARAWIARYRPPHLGRVVLLGPPNAGSEIADRLAAFAVFEQVFGPAALELTTRHRDRDDLLGPVDYPLGIVAGTRALDPMGWLMLPKPNDGKVSVARTRLVGAADHLVLPVTHSLMMRNARVIAATHHFLIHGRFASIA